MAARRPRSEFGLTGFLWRWIPALLLVFATYNPLKYSYFHWLIEPSGEQSSIALKVLVGVVLLIGYGIFVTATWKSLGALGVTVIVAFFLALLWVFYVFNVLTPDNPSEFAWIALVILATIMAVGMSWSGIWRRLTGQVTVDSGDDFDHDHD